MFWKTKTTVCAQCRVLFKRYPYTDIHPHKHLCPTHRQPRLDAINRQRDWEVYATNNKRLLIELLQNHFRNLHWEVPRRHW